jgi:hypothetical protein
VIVPLFNPMRYKSRWKHWRRFMDYIVASGACPIVVECAFGAREHATESQPLEEALGVQVVSVRGHDELWVKENLINLGLHHLPPCADYIAWIDADVIFADPAWVGRTIHALQHYDFVQMFSLAMDLGPNYEPVGPAVPSFVATPGPSDYSGGRRRTGLAWAARRDALDLVGGLIDFCILGSADWHMAHALVGLVDASRPDELSREYKDGIRQWQRRAKALPRGTGHVPGLLLHHWHGRKADRRYKERWRPLIDHRFNPLTDLKKNTDGVYHLVRGGDRVNKLRDALRSYFRERNEDSIDVDCRG